VVRSVFFVFLLAPSVLAQTPATIEGQVLDALTGVPIRKAVLTLRKIADDSRAAEADTDTSGRFRFTGVPPGEYTLAAAARGYLILDRDSARQPRREGTLFALAPAQNLSGLVLRLTPFGAISGRIVDDDGDPVAAGEVQVWHVTYRNWIRELAADRGYNTLTDDRGIFRIAGLPPGRYYLSAAPPNRTATDAHTARYVRT
jgi:protocatechuate 3,4-dioxygenase beta subunit